MFPDDQIVREDSFGRSLKNRDVAKFLKERHVYVGDAKIGKIYRTYFQVILDFMKAGETVQLWNGWGTVEVRCFDVNDFKNEPIKVINHIESKRTGRTVYFPTLDYKLKFFWNRGKFSLFARFLKLRVRPTYMRLLYKGVEENELFFPRQIIKQSYVYRSSKQSSS